MAARRIYQRIDVPANLELFVVFFFEDVPYMGQVRNFSMKGLQVVLDEVLESLQPGAELENVHISTPDGNEKLSHLTVQRVEHDRERNETRIGLAIDSIENMSRLWESLLAAQAQQAEPRHRKFDWSASERAFRIEEIPRIPGKGEYTREAQRERLNWLREVTTDPLTALEATLIEPEQVVGNIENYIGAVQIPVGLAGPCKIKGTHATGNYIAPFATTEGALVASATRGARACSLSGGITARVIGQRMLRAPQFFFEDLPSAFEFVDFIRQAEDAIRVEIAKVSKRAELRSIEPFNIGRIVHLRFYYTTGDAAGQNMTSVTTWAACQFILKALQKHPRIKLQRYFIEGNMSGDKKTNYQSLIHGRGFQVTAETVVTHEVLRTVLGTTVEKMVAGQYGSQVGATQIGMIGYNINFANVIAAIFTATGQDIACVHESSIGQFFVEPYPQGLYVAVHLPSLVIGTVGGGTRLPTQYECLEIMNCAGAQKAPKLAEIIAAYCLALDLSTGAAITTDQFVQAHDRLGRNRPSSYFDIAALTPEYFGKVMRRKVVSVTTLEAAGESGILTKMAVREKKKPVGILAYGLEYEGGQRQNVVVKLKPLDREVIEIGANIAQLSGDQGLIRLYYKSKLSLDFTGCHTRELEVFAHPHRLLAKFRPKVFHSEADPSRELYMLVMEDLSGSENFNSVEEPERWSKTQVLGVMKNLAEMHSAFYGRTERIEDIPSLHTWDRQRMVDAVPFFQKLLEQNNQAFPQLYDNALYRAMLERLKRAGDDWAYVDQHPKTLIHNDCNLRNACLRNGELCLFDWELACIHVPQRDVVEFLCYVTGPTLTREDWLDALETHRQSLETYSGMPVDPDLYLRVADLMVDDLLINRLAVNLSAHEYRPMPFIERVVQTARMFRELEG